MTKINNFSENGFIILKNAISKKLLNEIKNEIYNITLPKKIKKAINSFQKITQKLRISEFNFTNLFSKDSFIRAL